MKLNSQYIRLDKNSRLYNLEIPIIGLTGGIASGKSSISKILEQKKIPLIDADKLVKKIYQQHETATFIRQNYPTAIDNNVIDFQVLRQIFFTNQVDKNKIEQFIYSRLPDCFLNELKTINRSFIFYDVPLLFEKKLQQQIDISICVYCSVEQQLERLMRRDQCSKTTAQKILAQQLNIEQKKDLADFIIDNTGPSKALFQHTEQLLGKLLS